MKTSACLASFSALAFAFIFCLKWCHSSVLWTLQPACVSQTCRQQGWILTLACSLPDTSIDLRGDQGCGIHEAQGSAGLLWALLCREILHNSKGRDFHYEATRSLMHVFETKSPEGRHSKRQSPTAGMLFWVLVPLIHINSAYTQPSYLPCV